MMRSSKLPRRKSKAQAMVEFALALPVLLLVVYGLIEAGRLLFIYASVVTAARQAVRYGSATGINDAGILYYQDCAGITAAANKVAFIAPFSNINISYDEGPDSPSDISNCPPTSPLANGDRVKVRVTAPYSPIVPLIPGFKTFNITSSSNRTVLVSISIQVTEPPETWAGNPATLTPTQTFTPSPTATYTPTATNTSTPTVTFTPTMTRTPTATVTGTPPTPTFTLTPSNTPTPSRTPTPSFTPTMTYTPTITPTPVNCALITNGVHFISGSTMTMQIFNNTGGPVKGSNVTVSWNYLTGANGNKTLRLIGANLGTTTWSGSVAAPSYEIPGFMPLIPAGTSTITFTFDNTYVNFNNTELITIDLSITNGCSGYVLKG